MVCRVLAEILRHFGNQHQFQLLGLFTKYKFSLAKELTQLLKKLQYVVKNSFKTTIIF